MSASCVCHFVCGAIEPLLDDGSIGSNFYALLFQVLQQVPPNFVVSESLIQSTCASLEEKSLALFEALRLYLPEGCSLNGCDREGVEVAPSGGYFMLIQLCEGVSGSALAELCESDKYQLRVKSGKSCGDRLRDDRIRLCFAYHNTPELVEGARRLGDAIRELAAKA